MKKLPPRIKICEACRYSYECDKRYGKARAEKSKTCSVRCQRAWLGKQKRGTFYKKNPNPTMRKKTQQPFNITPSKTKKVYKVIEKPPQLSLSDFKIKMAAAAERRRKVY